MRDIRDAGRAVWMQPSLFDLLAGVQASMSAVHGPARVADIAHEPGQEQDLGPVVAGPGAEAAAQLRPVRPSAVHGSPLPVMVTSGYRTPEHNAALENAARNSMVRSRSGAARRRDG
jgi:hypothetical protein